MADDRNPDERDSTIVFSPLWWLWLPAAVPLLLFIAQLTCSEAVNVWLWSEQGPLETAHVLIPLLVAGVGAATLSRRRIAAARRSGAAWLVTAIAGLTVLCVLIAGEEASWGQHYFGWTTPETWAALNDQKETNLHNVSSWVDQKPRALLELAVVLFGIVVPIAMLCGREPVSRPPRELLPPLLCLPLALMAEGVRLVERLGKFSGGGTSAVFARPSELQELYFYLFFALCLLTYRRRLLARLATSAAAETTAVPVAPSAAAPDRVRWKPRSPFPRAA